MQPPNQELVGASDVKALVMSIRVHQEYGLLEMQCMQCNRIGKRLTMQEEVV
jgi:hypothetical protein